MSEEIQTLVHHDGQNYENCLNRVHRISNSIRKACLDILYESFVTDDKEQ